MKQFRFHISKLGAFSGRSYRIIEKKFTLDADSMWSAYQQVQREYPGWDINCAWGVW